MKGSNLGQVAILIGTYRDVTVKQVDYLQQKGFEARFPSPGNCNRIDVYRFRLDRDYNLLKEEFLIHLTRYNTLIISGGATANFILERSGFMYIENRKSMMPLVSSGIIRGGMLDGKELILKGGLIGMESCYIDILNKIGVLNE